MWNTVRLHDYQAFQEGIWAKKGRPIWFKNKTKRGQKFQIYWITVPAGGLFLLLN